MTLVDSRIGTQAVKVFFTFHIPNPNAFALRKHDAQRFVIMGAVFIFEFNVALCIHLFLS